MRYFPNSKIETDEMLATIGVESVGELFRDIPEAARIVERLTLPEPLSEQELLCELRDLAKLNGACSDYRSFLGGGAYDHYVPVAVDQLASRSEFYTAYTPYQPEISQGTLQAMFEFQTMVCGLLGMNISNASLYDGATAVAEAAWMVRRVSRKQRIIVAGALHPDYRQVLLTYTEPFEQDFDFVDADPATGAVSVDALRAAWTPETAAVIVQSPNFYGVLEDMAGISAFVRAQNGLLVHGFTDALAFGLVKPPGAYGADIAAGEGQALGIPVSFGGPYLGLFAARGRLVRSMPGRLVGETVDSKGDRGYVLTLSTREQHIRRERATSNICTNQGLCALSAAIYMSLMGPRGIQRVATASHLLSERLKASLSKVKGVKVPMAGPTFNEFVIELPMAAKDVVEAGVAIGIVPGLDLGRFHESSERRMLVSLTEKRSLADLDAYVRFLEGLLK
jgi:glycine dehydrogenase subunit 1